MATARKMRGLTQRALAKAVGVSAGAIAHYEQGLVTDIGGTVLLKLSTALDVSAAWLVYGTGDIHRPIRVTVEEADLIHTLRELTRPAQDALLAKAHEYREIVGLAPSRVHPVPAPKKQK